MDTDFERQLQARLAKAPDTPSADAFTNGVQRRIRQIRFGRRAVRVIAIAVLVMIVLALTPVAVTTAGLVAESATALSAGIGQLIRSPLAFVIGIVVAVFALMDQRTN